MKSWITTYQNRVIRRVIKLQNVLIMSESAKNSSVTFTIKKQENKFKPKEPFQLTKKAQSDQKVKKKALKTVTKITDSAADQLEK